jgi:hypothetical protein
VTIPISIDNNRNSRSVQSTEHDEYAMADLIAEGTILAVYTDESDSNYYLLRASSNGIVFTVIIITSNTVFTRITRHIANC